jgi:hypothetical protein
MDAELLLRERIYLSETEFVEMVIWRVEPSVRASAHAYKYRLAFMSDGRCVLRYDNEAGKGGHKHVGKRESLYDFISLRRLQADFWSDVKAWRERR